MDEHEIYNYLQTKWDELEKQDGGCYPSKQEALVFQLTAEHFKISVEKVKEIFIKLDKENVQERVQKQVKEHGGIKQALEAILENNKEFPKK